MGQIFWTHTDSGGSSSTIRKSAAMSTAVAISTSYYPEGRDVSRRGNKARTQIGVDMAGNVLKEFWPDFRRKFSREHKANRHAFFIRALSAISRSGCGDRVVHLCDFGPVMGADHGAATRPAASSAGCGAADLLETVASQHPQLIRGGSGRFQRDSSMGEA